MLTFVLVNYQVAYAAFKDKSLKNNTCYFVFGKWECQKIGFSPSSQKISLFQIPTLEQIR